MYQLMVKIGDHLISMTTKSSEVQGWVLETYCVVDTDDETKVCDLHLHIEDGYGLPFANQAYKVTAEEKSIIYERLDYQLAVERDFTRALLKVNEQISLKHAMMNLYSAFIVHRNWGLLIHSSCAIDGGRAHLFSGHSGAGKSTVARLSHPRMLLSDEATIVRIRDGQVDVLDSPFRSDTTPEFTAESFPLAAINLLQQSSRIFRKPLTTSEAILRMMDKSFYWAFSQQETQNILGLYKTLLQVVPVYELEFQKNDLFWEAIS